MGFRLTIAAGKECGKELAFDQDSVTLGRTSECDVVLCDPAVSRRHARIVCESSAFLLEDLRSSNGTKVNGALIRKLRLEDGDQISVGSMILRFCVATAECTGKTSVDQGSPIASAAAATERRKSRPTFWRKVFFAAVSVSILVTLGAALRALLTVAEGKVVAEPRTLSRAAIEDSFGLGEGVTHSHADSKVFEFELHAPGRAVAILHFQSKDISEGELLVRVNGANIGFVPPDSLDEAEVSHEVFIRPEVLKKSEKNQVAFESTRNPPGKDPWRIWNLWVETNALPEMPADQLMHEAAAAFQRAELNFGRREVAAPNRYSAWKDYRSAWLTLEAHPDPKPELYARALDRMQDAQRELDRICATFMLLVQRSYNLKDLAAARAALDEVKGYFPGTDQPCPWRAEQKRTELKL